MSGGKNEGGAGIVIVGGPTASGKSDLAVALATAFDGVIINADSMQLYRELPVLTAQPGPAALSAVEHRLYGVLSAADPCSAARWRAMAETELDGAAMRGKLAIVVGGTGLYLKALVEDLAPVPDVPAAVRAATRALIDEIGVAAMHRRLAARDAESASRIRPSDRQRIMRAWEVLEATGRPLADWQRDQQPPAAARRYFAIVLLPPRARVYAACDARFAAMVEGGALDEVRALLAQGLDPELPVMKAVGVRELASHLRGAYGLDEAILRGQQATRRYAKRQYTWFRHQMPGAEVIDKQYSESLAPKIFAKIRHFLLTAAT